LNVSAGSAPAPPAAVVAGAAIDGVSADVTAAVAGPATAAVAAAAAAQVMQQNAVAADRRFPWIFT